MSRRPGGVVRPRLPQRLRLVLPGLTTLAVACGGGSASGPSTPATPAPVPGEGPTIVISASGVSPKELTVAVRDRVTFFNQDSVPHEVASDPHPTHVNCPPINEVAALAPGQARQTGPFTAAGVCGFHDHGRPTDTSLQGTIVVR